jgi:hypothetical protein
MQVMLADLSERGWPRIEDRGVVMRFCPRLVTD